MVDRQPDTTDTSALFSNSQEYYQTLWNSSSIPQIVCQLDGTILDANSAYADLLDCPVVEVLGLNIWAIAQNDNAQQRSQCYRSLEQVGKFTIQQEYLTKSQQLFPVRLLGVKLTVREETLISVSVELISELTEQTGDLTTLVKKRTQELIDSQARYQQLCLNIPGVIYQFKLGIDGKFSFPYISSGCQELFELSAAEIMNNGNLAIDLIHRRDRDNFERVVTTSATTLKPKKWEGRIVLASGEMKWIQSASRPQKQADGSIIWDGLLMDISDRVTIETELQKSQQLLQLVFDTFPQCVSWKDTNFKYLGCNRQFAKDVGLKTPEQVIGKNDFDLGWKQYAHLYQAEDTLIIAGGTPKIGQEVTRIAPDGKVTWLKSSKLPLKNQQGETIGIFDSYEDISDRKREQQQTQIATDFLAKAINAINEPIFVKDQDHRWVMLNDAFCRFIGHSREELLGKSDYDFFPSEEADIFWAKDELVMITEQEDINREFLTDANGVRQTILTKKNCFKDLAGKTFLVGIILKLAEY
ncbi:MAG: PAS domain S-box protein [Pleurocapsa sp.]